MSLTEVGVYITLLSYQWMDGGLPVDVDQLARLARVPQKQFARMWANGVLRECFVERDGRFVNERLERVRQEAIAYRESSARGGRISAEVRRQKHGSAQPSKCPRSDFEATPEVTTEVKPEPEPNISSSLSLSSSKKKDKNVSSEPESGSEPAALTFPIIGTKGSEWGLSQQQLDAWVSAYPSLDVLAECRKARAWLEANNRKTAGGMPRFLVSWLNRAVNRGPSQPAAVNHRSNEPEWVREARALRKAQTS